MKHLKNSQGVLYYYNMLMNTIPLRQGVVYIVYDCMQRVRKRNQHTGIHMSKLWSATISIQISGWLGKDHS